MLCISELRSTVLSVVPSHAFVPAANPSGTLVGYILWIGGKGIGARSHFARRQYKYNAYTAFFVDWRQRREVLSGEASR